LELDWTHQLLVYADDVKLLGDSINTIKQNTETLSEAIRDIGLEIFFFFFLIFLMPFEASDPRSNGLEINAEKTKYMVMSRHQNSEQNQNIRTANESFENVAKFKYMETTLTNQNDIRDEIKNTLNSGNVCYYSVQNL
jgi:archaellum component FlaC